jgi:hypothetical protein
MITILKFPIYVEIESDNVDRKFVTEAANQVLYPNLLKYLSEAKYKSKVVEECRIRSKSTKLTVNLLTERDLFMERISKKNGQEHVDGTVSDSSPHQGD